MTLNELPAWADVKDDVLLVGELLSLENHPDPYAVAQYLSFEDQDVLEDRTPVLEGDEAGAAVALPEDRMSEDSQEDTQAETQVPP